MLDPTGNITITSVDDSFDQVSNMKPSSEIVIGTTGYYEITVNIVGSTTNPVSLVNTGINGYNNILSMKRPVNVNLNFPNPYFILQQSPIGGKNLPLSVNPFNVASGTTTTTNSIYGTSVIVDINATVTFTVYAISGTSIFVTFTVLDPNLANNSFELSTNVQIAQLVGTMVVM